MAELSVFVRSFLRDPLRTASLVPSSRLLAERMVRPLAAAHARGRRPVVVELGPGTGVVTQALLTAGPEIRYLGLELDGAMIGHLHRRFGDLDVVQAPASELGAALAARELADADLVVSGLPWQAWAGRAGHDLVSSVAAALSPTGAFTQFTYGWTLWAPPARRQRADLEAGFGQVDRSSVVWRNVPPAVVYTATRPRREVPA
ncbi:hypothetical protein ASG41_16455 [Modestobacter sp. Leaf380]|nr:hypothetical protein ASG41_16455 [Modestobacter sp. Leaf380]